jgi:signal peptidase I
MDWKPNKWLAAVLGLLLQGVAFLYIGRWRLALAFIAAGILLNLTELRFGGSGYSLLALSVFASILAYRTATKAAPVTVRPWFGRWYGMLGIAGTLIFSIVLLRAFLIEPFRMPSNAMAPTLDMGTTFLVSKIGYRTFGTYGVVLTRGAPSTSVPRGALVVFESPAKPGVLFVKRVVGLPGDAIVYKDKRLAINGRNATQSEESSDGKTAIVREEIDGTVYRTIVNKQQPAVDWQVTVSSNHYFFMGDNRDASADSRHFGAVSGELLVGQVVHVFHSGD